MEYKNDFDQAPEQQAGNAYGGNGYGGGQDGYGNNGYNNGNGYNNAGGGYGRSQVIVGEQDPGRNSSTFAVVSLVLGILSVVLICCIYWFSLIMGVIGLILGIISLVQNRDGKGMAIAGTILNGISILLSILLLILMLTIGIGLGDLSADYMSQDQIPYEEQVPEYENDFQGGPVQLSVSWE